MWLGRYLPYAAAAFHFLKIVDKGVNKVLFFLIIIYLYTYKGHIYITSKDTNKFYLYCLYLHNKFKV